MQSQRLVKALQDVGASAAAFPSEETDHVKLNADLGKPDDKPTTALFEFLEGLLKPGAAGKGP